MLKIISIEIATDPREPFAWTASPSPSTPSLWDFHKQVQERQRYLLRVSNLLSVLSTATEDDNIEDTIHDFFKGQNDHIRVTSHGRWTTYKQGSLTIMTEEQEVTV